MHGNPHAPAHAIVDTMGLPLAFRAFGSLMGRGLFREGDILMGEQIGKNGIGPHRIGGVWAQTKARRGSIIHLIGISTATVITSQSIIMPKQYCRSIHLLEASVLLAGC